MNDTVSAKANLWNERINAFQESGLFRKDWCQQNGIPQSTFSYWIRKLQSGISETENSSRLVFAKLPSEEEIQCIGSKENAPVTVYRSEKIRIEMGSDCPARLMDARLQVLKVMLDFFGGTIVYLTCGRTDLRKSYSGLAAIIKLKFHLDPYSRCKFAFCNRRRTLIKILQ